MFRMCQCQDDGKVLVYVVNEDVRALKDAFENLNTQEHIKKDSTPKILSLSPNLSSKVFIIIICGEFSIYNKFDEHFKSLRL